MNEAIDNLNEIMQDAVTDAANSVQHLMQNAALLVAALIAAGTAIYFAT